MSRSVRDPESIRERQARAQEADRISHDDPTNDPDERWGRVSKPICGAPCFYGGSSAARKFSTAGLGWMGHCNQTVKADGDRCWRHRDTARETVADDYDDPTNDPEGRALVQAIHDRKRKADMTTETPTIQAWTTENGDAIVWGTHDLDIAKEAYVILELDTEPDWGDVRLMWGAPHLPDWEVWSSDNYGNEPQEGWVPYMVFGF